MNKKLDKIYVPISKKIEILRKREVNIPNSHIHKQILHEYNYYNIINGYKDPFLEKGSAHQTRQTSEDLFIKGTMISEIEALYIFDNNLRNIFLTTILLIEERIKNQLINSFYEYYTSQSDDKKYNISNLHREDEYLKKIYYNINKVYVQLINKRGKTESKILNTPTKKDKCYIIDKYKIYYNFISIVYKEISKQRHKNDSIKKYIENHKYIPMWVLFNILTFGNISKFFQIQNKNVQKLFIKKTIHKNKNYLPEDIKILNVSRALHILSIFRNTCAHNERLYCIEISTPLDDNFYNFKQFLPYSDKKKLFKTQKNKKFNSRKGIISGIFSIYLFLNNNEYKEFISSIRLEIKKLSKQINTISIDKILNIMGLSHYI